MLYTNSNILCSICTKLYMFDKSANLKIMIMFNYGINVQLAVGLAHINLFDIFLYICIFKCILLNISCLSEATGRR